jgi:hypothetical protein
MGLPAFSVSEIQPKTEKILDIDTTTTPIQSVTVHEPEIDGDDVVLPIVLISGGKQMVFRTYLEKDRWREILG